MEFMALYQVKKELVSVQYKELNPINMHEVSYWLFLYKGPTCGWCSEEQVTLAMIIKLFFSFLLDKVEVDGLK